MTKLRPYLPADAELLAVLMQASILELAVDDYTQDQQDAWAAAAEAESFAKTLGSGLTLVALDDDDEPVGFAVLVQNRAISHAYVHPDLTGMGIGRALCEALVKLAAARDAEALTVDATDNARGFFETLGFVATARATINHGDEWLGATTMEKPLKAPKGAPLQ